MLRLASISLAFVIAFAGCGIAAAAEPSETFESMYGADFKKVKASRGLDDDVGLASQLVEAAKDARPEYAKVLCEKAYELAERSPTGSDKAADAMELLAEKVPARQAECLAKAVPARQRLFKAAKGPARVEAGKVLIDAMLAAADALCEAADGKAVGMARQASGIAKAVAPNRQGEVRDAIARIGTRLRVEKQIAGLKKRLDADSEDAASRTTLVRLLVVELDDPARAIPFLEGCTDEAMCKFVPAAAKPIEEAPELACKELGEWYYGLSQKAGSVAKEPTLVRAWRYLERYLRIHEAEDLARTEAAKAMENVEAGLEKLGEPKGLVVGPGRWVNLLPHVKLTEDMLRRDWTPQGTGVVTGGGNLRLPCRPRGSYQLSARVVALKKGWDGARAGFNLPVGKGAGTYSFASGGTYGGIAVDRGPKVPPGQVVVGKPYHVDIRVIYEEERSEIIIRVDDKPHLRWRGDPSNLRWGFAAGMPTKEYLGLGVPNSPGPPTMLFADVRLRMISGKMRLLR